MLHDIDLVIDAGEFVSIMGPSGSGKSTLLNILGILDDYDTGSYTLAGTLITHLSETEAAVYRNRHLGFIFQSFHLLPFKTVIEKHGATLILSEYPTDGRFVDDYEMSRFVKPV